MCPSPRLRHRQLGHSWKQTTIDQLPAAAGCYAIFRIDKPPPHLPPKPERLIYIGSANNIRARLQDFGIGNRRQSRETHFGQVDRLALRIALNRHRLHHLTREARLIARLLPPLNRTTWRSSK